LRGDAREELTRKVNQVRAHVLIMGCRGLGMFKRAFLGSTSDYCLHHVECPVIIVKHCEEKIPPEPLMTPAATGH
jgi:nucleotide-binding universal stress UspA family protein